MCQHPLSGVSPYSGVLTNPTERYMLTQAPITGTVTGRLCSAVDRLKTITRKPTGLCSTELYASALARLTNPAEAPVPRQSGARPTAPGDAPRRGILGPFRPRAPGDRPGPTKVFFGKKHFFFKNPKSTTVCRQGGVVVGPASGGQTRKRVCDSKRKQLFFASVQEEVYSQQQQNCSRGLFV